MSSPEPNSSSQTNSSPAAAPEPARAEHAGKARAGDNLDPAEVKRFADLAATWWDTEGEFKPLHEIGPARLSFIRDAIVRHFGREPGGLRPLKGLRILDVGCGGGLICEPLARMGGEVTGIDPGEETIAAASAHALQQGLSIDYRATTIEAVGAGGETFDVVTCLEVLEHVPDPKAFLANCAMAVRPGGLLITSTLNRTMKSYALAIVAAEYVLRWLPRGTHDWNKFLSTDEVAEALAAAGLEDARFEGIVFDPLSGQWRRDGDTDVNYMASAARPS